MRNTGTTKMTAGEIRRRLDKMDKFKFDKLKDAAQSAWGGKKMDRFRVKDRLSKEWTDKTADQRRIYIEDMNKKAKKTKTGTSISYQDKDYIKKTLRGELEQTSVKRQRVSANNEFTEDIVSRRTRGPVSAKANRIKKRMSALGGQKDSNDKLSALGLKGREEGKDYKVTAGNATVHRGGISAGAEKVKDAKLVSGPTSGGSVVSGSTSSGSPGSGGLLPRG